MNYSETIINPGDLML